MKETVRRFVKTKKFCKELKKYMTSREVQDQKMDILSYEQASSENHIKKEYEYEYEEYIKT